MEDLDIDLKREKSFNDASKFVSFDWALLINQVDNCFNYYVYLPIWKANCTQNVSHETFICNVFHSYYNKTENSIYRGKCSLKLEFELFMQYHLNKLIQNKKNWDNFGYNQEKHLKSCLDILRKSQQDGKLYSSDWWFWWL